MELVERAIVTLVISAVALLVAAILLDRFTISTLSFPIVVVVFTVVWLVARPIAKALLEERTREVSWVIGLVATWATLVITDLVSDGIDIEGIGTWILATIVVWGAMVVGDMVVDALVKKTAEP